MPRRVTEEQRNRYISLRHHHGLSASKAAQAIGVSNAWARKFDAEYRGDDDNLVTDGPIPFDRLKKIDRQALDDFELFRRRFFGRRCLPWAVESAHTIESKLISPVKEYGVINVAPGVGKTTLVHDICAWQTVKRRYLRGTWGSSTVALGTRGTRRLRATFERTTPLRARDRERELGEAEDAVATLLRSYGRFKPSASEWRADLFSVEQTVGELLDEKEPTWAAFGRDSELLGYRVDLMVWDDVVTAKILNNIEVLEDFVNWWDTEAETRLDPAGLLVLVGQRLRANDLYRHCLDKYVDVWDTTIELSDEEEQALAERRQAMYFHIVFKAHDQEKCVGHGKGTTPKAWPDGCLIDPYRLSWRQCQIEMRDRLRWETVFQQNDASDQDVLVQRVWLEGGLDPRTRELHPGCWDDRALLERPNPDVYPGRLLSYFTVDPSAVNWWAIQWWLWHEKSETYHLMDLCKSHLTSGEFLQEVGGVFTGLAEEWQQRSEAMGLPGKVWVVEDNAAQRYLLQYEFVKRWMRTHSVRVLPHATHKNKADTKFGVQTIGPLYQHGSVRLPGRSKFQVKPLTDELTRWPHTPVEDQVMADWMGKYNLRIIRQSQEREPIVRKAALARPPEWMVSVA